MVSADHYISQAPGRLYHTKGESDPSDMFSGGCVFIEHASGYVSIKHQVDINATELSRQKSLLRRRLRVREWLSRDTTLIMGYSTPQSLWRIC